MMRLFQKLMMATLVVMLSACGGGGSDEASTGSLVGRWELSDSGSGRVPGFLQGHGYEFSADGSWKTLRKMNNGADEVYLTGTYTLNDGHLVMSGKNIHGSTDVTISGDELILEQDVSIRGGDGAPARTTYRRL